MNAPCSTGMEWAAHLGLPPIRALPPTFGSPCAAPPCPRFVHRDSSAVPTSIFKPPAEQRFSLIVPTSLIERNFDMNFVLQCGLTVVFKRLNRDPSQPAETLEAVHGCLSRHLSPIGLTSYRVTGHQPAGVGSGCSLHSWSVEDGCLVVEVASRHHRQRQQLISDAQESAPVPARRLFGDCLPSPATIRKERPPRDESPESPEEHPYPLQNQHGCHNLLPQQLQEASETSTTDVTTLRLLQEIQSDDSGHKVTEDVTIAVPSSCEGESSSSLPAWDDSPETYKDITEPSQVLSKPAQEACISRRHDNMVVTTPDKRPKRHRRCPTWYSKDEELSTAFPGIDLLLAAHMVLVQQEASRPKRLRRPNSLFVH
ncbi:hypothetical protein Vafri_4128 [Volvox africanus]|uniref:Uncharacterized protein n=1 Tax=Volvox africanus TaxID=51714 RepID=A0A8J4EX12_9CHLO|nr:hypothetical protein Vafri_4128 [Volvox africanus]